MSSLDKNTHLSFLLSKRDCSKYEDGTIVVAKITHFPNRDTKPRAKVKEVIGHPEKRFLAIDLLIKKYDLPTEYPPEVVEEVEAIPEGIPQEEVGRRGETCVEQVCFTIDPEKARDFDDAVAIELTPEGNYRLFVHIADVSYYVRPGTALDEEAYRRGFTFYLPDRALHMLPEKLSAGLCSLRPDEDRLAFTCEMVFNEKGDIVFYDIYESVIREQAQACT
ncbi:MAG: RNB domain-containing ribonuclease [Aquificota bacterium]|nr:RNB domain-containing ribonuclease [Aquificota bacterium]